MSAQVARLEAMAYRCAYALEAGNGGRRFVEKCLDLAEQEPILDALLVDICGLGAKGEKYVDQSSGTHLRD